MVRHRNNQLNHEQQENKRFPIDSATWKETIATLALSPQQARIVELIICGDGDKQIAPRLGLSVDTVRTYLKRINARLGVHGRVELVVKVFATAIEITKRNECHRKR